MFIQLLLSLIFLVGICSFKPQAQTFTDDITTIFIDESEISNSLFLFHRNRDRYNESGITNISTRDNYYTTTNSADGYASDLDHTTLQFGLNYTTGRWQDFVSYNLSAYGATDLQYDSQAVRNIENEFSFAGERWGEENHDQAQSGIAIITNEVNLMMLDNNVNVKFGQTALYVPGIIGVNWSNYPGTYQGVQANYRFGSTKQFHFYSAYANKYKAPWYIHTQNFYKVNAWEPLIEDAKIDFIWAIGSNYTTKAIQLEFSYGQSEHYLQSYYFKVEKRLPIGDESSISYLFYGSDSIANDTYQLYTSPAWMQGIRFHLEDGHWHWRAEFLANKAEGAGNYLPRLTRGYANSQGASEFWWDSRSDWNHDGEKAVFISGAINNITLFGASGWRLGLSGAYGWGAKRWVDNQLDVAAPRGKEWAINYDISYLFQNKQLKGIEIDLHFTQYHNKQDDLGSWYYPNMFTSERDLKLAFMAPFQLF